MLNPFQFITIVFILKTGGDKSDPAGLLGEADLVLWGLWPRWHDKTVWGLRLCCWFVCVHPWPDRLVPPLLLLRPESRHEDQSGHVSHDLQKGQYECWFHVPCVLQFKCVFCILYVLCTLCSVRSYQCVRRPFDWAVQLWEGQPPDKL